VNQLRVNGKEIERAAGTTVSALLEQMAIDHRKVAVEQNGSIVPKSAYPSTILQAADVIEIIGFIGGG
jgi:sulfur carrier protein